MGVMAAYHEIDGIPITADPFLLKTILRQEWGFQGFVLSDLGAIQRLYTVHHVAASPKDAACMAIRSGVDMQFYDFDHDVFQKALIDCVHEGSLPQADLDRAVQVCASRQVRARPFRPSAGRSRSEPDSYRSPKHLAVSLRSALESMTLLKNDNHLLPLSKSLHHIAVIGPNADVARYGDYEKETNGEHISLLQGIRALLPEDDVHLQRGQRHSVGRNRCEKRRGRHHGAGRMAGHFRRRIRPLQPRPARLTRSNCWRLSSRPASLWFWYWKTDGL